MGLTSTLHSQYRWGCRVPCCGQPRQPWAALSLGLSVCACVCTCRLQHVAVKLAEVDEELGKHLNVAEREEEVTGGSASAAPVGVQSQGQGPPSLMNATGPPSGLTVMSSNTQLVSPAGMGAMVPLPPLHQLQSARRPTHTRTASTPSQNVQGGELTAPAGAWGGAYSRSFATAAARDRASTHPLPAASQGPHPGTLLSGEAVLQGVPTPSDVRDVVPADMGRALVAPSAALNSQAAQLHYPQGVELPVGGDLRVRLAQARYLVPPYRFMHAYARVCGHGTEGGVHAVRHTAYPCARLPCSLFACIAAAACLAA